MRMPGKEEDRFFVNLETNYIEWMYYNPDSNVGGQYVINQFTLEHIMDALLKYPKGTVEVIFDHIGQNCKQYLADVGTPFYRQCKNRYENDAIAKGISVETFQHIVELFLAKDLINKYCMEEFESMADFSNLEKVGIAYSTTEDGCHEIQVNANLKEMRLETFLNNELVITQEFKTMDEMNYKCLMDLDFNELTCIPDAIIEDWEQNARADDLAVRLTVFISEVDPYVFADSLEVGEGMPEAIAKMRAQLREPICISETICELQIIRDECGLENADLYKCYDLMYDLQRLYNERFNSPVYDRETIILDDMFDALDVRFHIGFDEKGIKISDGEHTWHNQEFYKWFNENMLPVEKCRELQEKYFTTYADYKELSEHYGIRVGTKERNEKEKESR